jgi:hypothetical protein
MMAVEIEPAVYDPLRVRGRVNANRPTSVDDTKTLRFPFLEGHHWRGPSPTTLGELLRERFYCDGMGFTGTDRGQALGFDLVFLSRNPDDHHQIVLATGEPANIPPNTVNPHRRCSRPRARQGPVHRRRHSHLEIGSSHCAFG